MKTCLTTHSKEAFNFFSPVFSQAKRGFAKPVVISQTGAQKSLSDADLAGLIGRDDFHPNGSVTLVSQDGKRYDVIGQFDVASYDPEQRTMTFKATLLSDPFSQEASEEDLTFKGSAQVYLDEYDRGGIARF